MPNNKNGKNNGWKPKPGEPVWIYHLNVANRDGGVTANVGSREFQKVLRNYLGKPDNTRWVLVRPSTGPHHFGGGIAYRPESVYRTEQEATNALRAAVKAKIMALENALYFALEGGGAA